MEVPIIISDENNKSEISSRKKLKNRLTTGTFALLIALLAVVSATYAWYVYNHRPPYNESPYGSRCRRRSKRGRTGRHK